MYLISDSFWTSGAFIFGFKIIMAGTFLIFVGTCIYNQHPNLLFASGGSIGIVGSMIIIQELLSRKISDIISYG